MVETEELTKRYGGVTALEGCSLAVGEGEIFGLLGPNGAGKTTLLRLLLGFLRPTAGRARIGGWDCCSQSLRVRAIVAYLPGEARLFRQLPARRVLQFFADIRPGGDLRRSLALAERLELDLARRVSSMSTGMRQKLALAATLAANTPVVILDEPTSNLDPTIRAIVLELVAEASREGRTVIFSSHVLSEVESVCQRVAFLRSGRLVHVQPMAELKRQHRIRVQLRGILPPLPPQLRHGVRVVESHPGDLTLETSGELAPLLGWLAALPLRDIAIEPVGLHSLYRRLHDQIPASGEPAAGRGGSAARGTESHGRESDPLREESANGSDARRSPAKDLDGAAAEPQGSAGP